MSADIDIEVVALRDVLRDLVALSAVPAAWVGREPAAVAAGLADTLFGLLRLDFVYVRLCVPDGGDAVDAARGDGWKTFPGWLEGLLRGQRPLAGKEVVPRVDGGTRHGVVIPIGIGAESGMVAASCDRSGFPSENDQLLLNLAANHAATVFQSMRLKERQAQMWSLESLDRIDLVIQGADDLHRMTDDVLDVVLATFHGDRAWLVYPCDPGPLRSGEGRIRVERARPEYASGRPDDAGIAAVSQLALESGVAVRFDPESGQVLPRELGERFGVKSMIAVTIYPKVDRPYLLVLHQCSYHRVWTLEEERLLREIARRLGDALDTLLMFRDLRESERNLERSRADVTASRARIVAAADDTRRRIERDLHDGVQQRLVSLLLAQRTAQALVPPGLSELRTRLSETADGLAGALDDLREIARGIHPAILAGGGLSSALKTLVRRSGVPARLDVRIDTPLPEPVEVAAYYIVAEALTNTAKHSRASTVNVVVEARRDVLELSVCDDGVGGADPARGSGLIGLTDRVDAAGGTSEIVSLAGAGTTLRVTLPLS